MGGERTHSLLLLINAHFGEAALTDLVLGAVALLTDKVFLKSAADLCDLLISDLELVRLAYDFFEVRQQLVLRVGRVERFEILVDLAEV
mmetsp:Transcript_23293/g.28876  ORF Transcript_23293/g.28876 Transcript_23293/m.28876 type:complete len:89 (-) Transcript_23293:711-977(-)